MIRYTDAPESYDGFGTRTIQTLRAKRQDGRESSLRVVQIDDEYDDWQRGRYASGLYQSLDTRGFEMLFERVT